MRACFVQINCAKWYLLRYTRKKRRKKRVVNEFHRYSKIYAFAPFFLRFNFKPFRLIYLSTKFNAPCLHHQESWHTGNRCQIRRKKVENAINKKRAYSNWRHFSPLTKIVINDPPGDSTILEYRFTKYFQLCKQKNTVSFPYRNTLILHFYTILILCW